MWLNSDSVAPRRSPCSGEAARLILHLNQTVCYFAPKQVCGVGAGLAAKRRAETGRLFPQGTVSLGETDVTVVFDGTASGFRSY